VLNAGPTPHIDTEAWLFRVDGMVGTERQWTWDEFHSALRDRAVTSTA
jgi:DMSO/TMAO reductase YedYZ molybdopterin-dependent catalytic subunit